MTYLFRQLFFYVLHVAVAFAVDIGIDANNRLLELCFVEGAPERLHCRRHQLRVKAPANRQPLDSPQLVLFVVCLQILDGL